MLLLAVAILLVNVPAQAQAQAQAREREWHVYENEHFIAYSNASPDQALAHLVELEQIRAAALTILTIDIPDGLPKTKLLLFRSKKEFSKASPAANVAAFVMNVGGETIMVLPLAGSREWSAAVIRHELIHVLVRAGTFRYPTWYEEGFAELASSMRIVDGGKSFTFGEPTTRDSSGGPPVFDWDELVSDRFATHSISDARMGSSAYLQAWLLTHYVTLGEGLSVNGTLRHYLELIQDGSSSTEAFENAFGMSARQLWLKKLRYYARELQVYTFKLPQDAVHANFDLSLADSTVLDPLIAYFEDWALASKSSKVPKGAPLLMDGEWDTVRPNGVCATSGRIAVNAESTTVSIERFEQLDDGSWVAAVLSIASRTDRGLLLRVPESDQQFSLSMRTPDLMCFNPAGQAENRCTVVFRRCGA